MRQFWHIVLGLLIPVTGFGQLEVDTEIRLIGTPDQRDIVGIAPATQNSSAITVEASLLGGAHWAMATFTDQTITLDQPIGLDAYRPGTLLRFSLPAAMDGAIMLQFAGLDELPLLRVDGQEPVPGQLTAGTIAEVLFATDHWVLLSPGGRGCPPGSLQVHQGLCIDQAAAANVVIYEAMDQCQAKGGKLCTWDEYYLGCTLLEDQLTGLYTQWEWLDETSNHTHTADQAGRYTCRTQRSSNPVLIQGAVRCCYHLR